MNTYKARLNSEGRLNDDVIVDLIGKRQSENKALDTFKSYFKGKNTEIDTKESGKKISVPYARTLILITVGFMYKTGLIKYGTKPGESGKLLEEIQEVFDANGEEQLNTELGQDQAVYGEAYELHYVDMEDKKQFARVTPQQFIPVYSYSIKPELIAGIRFYAVTDDEGNTTTEVDVYYKDIIQYFLLDADSISRRVGGDGKEMADQPHRYRVVPVVIYKNNTDSISDIEPIKGLLDAYDSLISCYLDDEEKFAEAVLLMFGRQLDDDTLDKLANLRLIDGLDKDTDHLEYLTKNESQSARKELMEIIKQEIHRHSFVPDMTDPSVLGQKSGEAFQYLFALFELSAAVKEAYFHQGLSKRLKLTARALKFPAKSETIDPEVETIQVKFTRNLPKDNVMWKDIVADLWGMLPADTLVKLLPFVEDPEAVLDEMEKEKTGDGKTAQDVKTLYNETQESEEREAV